MELEHHLRTAASNATYISKTTQNQLIRVAGDIISDKIVEHMAEAKYFAVLANEIPFSERTNDHGSTIKGIPIKLSSFAKISSVLCISQT